MRPGLTSQKSIERERGVEGESGASAQNLGVNLYLICSQCGRTYNYYKIHAVFMGWYKKGRSGKVEKQFSVKEYLYSYIDAK